jgi:tetratricopeptide (TPR) repeat protein
LDGEYRPATEQALLWHAREAKLIAARIGPDPEHWEFADVATWHLGRLIEHGPRQASLFARRAACFYRIGDFASALADYSTAIALAPDASAHYGRGNCLAELGRWAEARAEFRRAAEAQHDMSHALSQLAFAHLAARDDVGFRSVCDEILKCVSQFKTPDDPSAAAWTCLLIPGIANDSAQIQALVDRCSELYWLYSRPVHALADYRRGDFEQVIQRINKRWEHNEVDPRYQEWLLMAMAHHKLGRRSEAHQWFQKAADWIKENAERNDQQPTDYFLTWDQRLELSVLHAEAESLMKEGE